MNDWSPDSWKQKPIHQAVAYPDAQALERVLARISQLPPLVTSWEVETLKELLAQAARGEAFLLQGGDCAERFADCRSDTIVAHLKILLNMSMVLTYGAKRRIIRVGRFAGQYAKPRSADIETRDGVTLPAYRGDMVNHPEFTTESRTPDPALLLRGYECSALTLNFIRGLVEGGFADLHHPEYWNLSFVKYAKLAEEYMGIVGNIANGLDFLETLAARPLHELRRMEFYTSHEGLHLPYEQTQTRQVPRRSGWYDLTCHFPWLGNRTRNLDGAHIEFFRGIINPIGVKVDAKISPDELVELARVLNPDNEPGRLTFIHRFGAKEIRRGLPPLVEAIRKSGQIVLWVCDPMHGNTITTQTGRKTRYFDAILFELDQAYEIHRACGSQLGGVHFELTGENVTECLGGARDLTEADLEHAYQTDVDPRLNYEQSLEMALLLARKLHRNGTVIPPATI
jgi:3-deoxy-7-phosphoheptulonate synthase